MVHPLVQVVQPEETEVVMVTLVQMVPMVRTERMVLQERMVLTEVQEVKLEDFGFRAHKVAMEPMVAAEPAAAAVAAVVVRYVRFVITVQEMVDQVVVAEAREVLVELVDSEEDLPLECT